jgi:nucleotide-binding universal stress UspA family protein
MITILFPTDFSKNAIHASLYAGMIARGINANLILLHVYSIPMATESQIPYDVDGFLKISKEAAEENLQVFAKELIKATGITPNKVREMTDYGQTTDSVNRIAKTEKVDFIMMGTKGVSNMLDKWLGTNAQNVLESADCPVWIIPENAPLNYPKMFMYAADFKEDDVVSTHKVLEIAKPLRATCKVIHIHDYYEEISKKTVKAKVSELNYEFADEDDVTIKNIDRQEVYDGLRTYVRTHKPDVLALAVHHKSFLSKIFERSITEHFVQEGNIPLLTFRK